ncbi:MAG: nucleoside 2-deoxyribosyltransferase [Anaerolineae bacterium]|nr:nucleoside 2-deoxyribosyltransferase [Anaerolineae bacterium]
MKVYFAGPLFTPYVQHFISEHARILREHGIEVFVPHENFTLHVTSEMIDVVVGMGLLDRTGVESRDVAQHINTLLRKGKVTREQLDLPPVTPEIIFQKDYEGLSTANAVVALLDGAQVDDGTACEIGIFYGLLREDPTKKGVIGFMTDFRGTRKAKHGFGINLFVEGVIEECGRIVDDFDEVVAQLLSWDSE